MDSLSGLETHIAPVKSKPKLAKRKEGVTTAFLGVRFPASARTVKRKNGGVDVVITVPFAWKEGAEAFLEKVIEA